MAISLGHRDWDTEGTAEKNRGKVFFNNAVVELVGHL